MNLLIIIFSIILGIGGIIGLIWKIKSRKPYITSFLETGTPTPGSYKESERTKNRYFMTKDNGVVDLKKNPEFLRFKELFSEKEYLIKPWKRDGDLYLEEGVTRVVIFEIIRDRNNNVIAIPCLRTVETIIHDKSDNPLTGYQETFLGVSWSEGQKVVKSENLLGVVEYESI